jgi:MFS family permease
LVELVDELADGAKGTALPLIRHDLALSYGQVGLLASVPILDGGLLELPLGLLAGDGRARRRAILGGGIVFVLTLVAVAFARTLPELMIAFVAFYPASGAFVSLTQAELMDAAPDRQAQHMARWDLAGSSGAVAGPLMLAAVLASGGGWRDGYLVLGGCGAAAWLGVCRRRPVSPIAPAGTAGAGGAAEASETGGVSETRGASDAETGDAEGASAVGGASAAGGQEPWTARAGSPRLCGAVMSCAGWSFSRWRICWSTCSLASSLSTWWMWLTRCRPRPPSRSPCVSARVWPGTRRSSSCWNGPATSRCCAPVPPRRRCCIPASWSCRGWFRSC